MIFLFTARHFKAHDSLKQFAEAEIQRPSRFYDGIIKAEVILSYDKPVGSIKNAEIIFHAKNNHTFTAKESTDDFKKSIEAAMDKIEIQVRKFKDKLTSHNNHKAVKHIVDSETESKKAG
jgi:putative sigma-54 modulation protein